MTTYSYKKIVKQAKKCKKNVINNQSLGISTKWSYYLAKCILEPNKNITRITISKPDNPKQSKMSRQINKADYLDIVKRYVSYVEKHNRLPNYIEYKGFKLKPRHLTVLFSKIVLYHYKYGKRPKQVNFNWKWFIKPSETGNEVYDYFIKKTGIKLKYFDDFCDWIKNKVNYEFYFDDRKSNKEVIDSKAGNCTDLLQLAVNIAEALDYEWKIIHTQCKQSGTGHVYAKFRKKGSTAWFIRDVACIADNSDYCVWCNVDNGGGYLLDVNPSWFLENLHR